MTLSIGRFWTAATLSTKFESFVLTVLLRPGVEVDVDDDPDEFELPELDEPEDELDELEDELDEPDELALFFFDSFRFSADLFPILLLLDALELLPKSSLMTELEEVILMIDNEQIFATNTVLAIAQNS